MFTEKVKTLCHLQNVLVGDSALTAIKMKTYTLMPEAVSSYSKYLNDVLVAIYSFMDKMNYYPTNLISDIKCNTIIVWDKSK
uniref:Uncharacterized protein n=1 Tax=Eubacterium cellulosolvens (strain ATCC 43171 / JCM 9499 / 6) TaxID=633697 RepID=I5AWM6_EUBC6